MARKRIRAQDLRKGMSLWLALDGQQFEARVMDVRETMAGIEVGIHSHRSIPTLSRAMVNHYTMRIGFDQVVTVGHLPSESSADMHAGHESRRTSKAQAG